MAYTVSKTSSGSYTVQDGVVNTQTDLSLIGKGYAGYGESIAENFLHLLENFSNNLQEMKNAIKEKDGSKLVKIFTSTKEIRKEIVKAGQDTKKPDFGRKKD